MGTSYLTRSYPFKVEVIPLPTELRMLRHTVNVDRTKEKINAEKISLGNLIKIRRLKRISKY
jgi:hypothetical protein